MKHENYDLYFPDQPVVDLYLPIWANLPAFRAKPAFVWAEDDPARTPVSSTLTYEQLNTSVQNISTQLLQLQLQKGDTVVILCPPGLELVEIIFACQRAGLIAVPVVPPHPSFATHNNHHHHLVRVLSQTKPKAAIANRNYVNALRAHTSSTNNSHGLPGLLRKIKWISTDELKGVTVKSNDISRYNGCNAHDVYLIQYTSGATSVPKPVLVTAGAAAHNVRVARKAYDLHPNSVIVSWLPMYHDCGLMFLLLTIVSGATCVLTSPAGFLNRPRLWLELISDHRATCTPVPSFTLPLVVRRGGVSEGTSSITLGTLKNLIIINEPIYKDSIEGFVKVFGPFGLNPTCVSPSYGLAENCTFVSTSWRLLCSSSGENDIINFPIFKNLLPSAKLDSSSSSSSSMEEEEIEILIVDEETHEPVSDGVEGEIWVSSPSNAAGYLDHPSLTREIFNARLRNKAAAPCFVRTGDTGVVVGEERYLYVTGRISDIIKLSGGREVHPHFIETAAYSTTCGRNTLRPGCIAAFGISGDGGSVAVVAELQGRRRGGSGAAAVEVKVLREVCEGIKVAVMDAERVSVGLVILVESGSLPKTSSGKIQRWAAKYRFERGGGADFNVVMKMAFESKHSTRNYLPLISSSL
ncbi:hypothetical protein ABFS82_03G060100 [Erythranthe guttata]|nr:PREDICTED: disco-interacting protein 2 homolog C-like [Erythranthe guttata]|eukprot:XP_012846690.1 PREDICTED: disco-interacting protein 2 homolog C-like [Erythranthe guttata]